MADHRPLMYISLVALVAFAPAAFGQAAPADGGTLQSLVSEVRQLRQVLQATTVNAQRIQVAMFRLQIQELAVAQASQRLDGIRSKISVAESARKHVADAVQTVQNLQNRRENPKERDEIEEDLRRLRKELELRAGEEQQLRMIESEAAAQLQAEQAKLTELQDRLDHFEKALDAPTQRP